MLVLNITNYCNKKRKCEYCLNRGFINSSNYCKKELSLEDIKKMFKQGKLNEKTIGLSGGEPTTNSNLEKIIEYLTNKEKQVVIATNLEEYKEIDPNGNLYWQLSLHTDEVEKRLNNAEKYIKEGHNINCFLIPVYDKNFNEKSLKTIARECYCLNPTTPLFFRYSEDTPWFKNNLDPKELNDFVYKKIKTNYHPFVEVLFHVRGNKFI